MTQIEITDAQIQTALSAFIKEAVRHAVEREAEEVVYDEINKWLKSHRGEIASAVAEQMSKKLPALVKNIRFY